MLRIGYGVIRESRSLTQPRISLRSILATNMRHRPVFTPAPRFAGHSCSFSPERGVRNAGRFTAPAAPGVPARNRHTRHPVPEHRAAAARESSGGATFLFASEGSPPRKQVLRLRSARGWTLRLAACPQELSLSLTRRLVRTDCRPDMHLDRPPVAPSFDGPCPAAPGRSIRNPQSFRPGIVAATASSPAQ
jgi:hypothetical protein